MIKRAENSADLFGNQALKDEFLEVARVHRRDQIDPRRLAHWLRAQRNTVAKIGDHYLKLTMDLTDKADFVTAYNFARRLKILKGLSPYEYICNAWTKSQVASSSTRSSKCRD